jgi:hypothetical protein
MINMGNPFCPKDKKLMKKTRSGDYRCPKCKVTYKAGQDVILPREPEILISEADAKLMQGKGEKKSVMSFKDKVQMFRQMRRRKSHKEKGPEWQGGPMQEVPDVQKATNEPALLTTPFFVGIVNYQCKDCHEKFEGMSGETQCIGCGSKNIEVVEQKTATKKDSAEAKGAAQVLNGES